jgi:hypothetical protein
MNRRLFTFLFLVCAVVVLVVSGCGSDDGGDQGPGQQTETVETTETTEE